MSFEHHLLGRNRKLKTNRSLASNKNFVRVDKSPEEWTQERDFDEHAFLSQNGRGVVSVNYPFEDKQLLANSPYYHKNFINDRNLRFERSHINNTTHTFDRSRKVTEIPSPYKVRDFTTATERFTKLYTTPDGTPQQGIASAPGATTGLIDFVNQTEKEIEVLEAFGRTSEATKVRNELDALVLSVNPNLATYLAQKKMIDTMGELLKTQKQPTPAGTPLVSPAGTPREKTELEEVLEEEKKVASGLGLTPSQNEELALREEQARLQELVDLFGNEKTAAQFTDARNEVFKMLTGHEDLSNKDKKTNTIKLRSNMEGIYDQLAKITNLLDGRKPEDLEEEEAKEYGGDRGEFVEGAINELSDGIKNGMGEETYNSIITSVYTTMTDVVNNRTQVSRISPLSSPRSEQEETEEEEGTEDDEGVSSNRDTSRENIRKNIERLSKGDVSEEEVKGMIDIILTHTERGAGGNAKKYKWVPLIKAIFYNEFGKLPSKNELKNIIEEVETGEGGKERKEKLKFSARNVSSGLNRYFKSKDKKVSYDDKFNRSKLPTSS